MYFIRLLLLLSLLMLASCSSQMEVNLFARHIDKDKVTEISNAISSKGLSMTVNHLPFPDSVRGSVIVYTPSSRSNKQVYQLVHMLGRLGYNVESVSIIGIENHRFTENNIGLYLIPDGVVINKKETTLDVVNDYGSVLCGNNLRLNQDNSFKIEIDIWQEEKQDYLQQIVLGKWQEDDEGIITLRSDSWRAELRFKRKVSIENSTNGHSQTVTLVPLYNMAEQGGYLKENIEEANVNCHYSISLAI